MREASLKSVGYKGLAYSFICAGFFNAYTWIATIYPILMKAGDITRSDELICRSLTVTLGLGFLLALSGSVILILNQAWGGKIFVSGACVAIIHPFFCMIAEKISFLDLPFSTHDLLTYLSLTLISVLVLVVPGIIIAKKLPSRV